MILAILFSILSLLFGFFKVKIWKYPWFIVLFPLYPFLFLALVTVGKLWAIKRGYAYHGMEPDSRRTIKNQHARRVGYLIFYLGGIELMINAANSIYYLDDEAFYQLEWCWYGIGGWLP